MGYLVTAGSIAEWPEFALLIAASSLLYTSGMVLNDVFDMEVDSRERPQRPLPSGQVPLVQAQRLGWWFLAAGIALAWLAGMAAGGAVGPWWRPGLVATLLAVCVVWYDAGMKRTLAGPLVMGSCRFFNVLLGMSIHAIPRVPGREILGWDPAQVVIAAGMGTYIVGVTVFARSEAARSPRGALALGIAIMAAGIALLAAFPSWFPASLDYRLDPQAMWPLVMVVMSIWILRRCMIAVLTPDPRYVQSAIKFCLMSLIVLDATLCLLVCPPMYAVGILVLLIPMLVLGRWMYST
jgi:4-hydroxybenzoate polyprenyltransferase